MNMYVGITDYEWYCTLKKENCKDINFWTPGAAPFKAIQENDIFLFKLHSKYKGYIVGGGFFVKFTVLPTYLAWSAFGVGNGVYSVSALNESIDKYRSRNNMLSVSNQIGCIILTDPFFFDESDWIESPVNWSKCIVRGKRYSTDDEIGQELYLQIQERLSRNLSENTTMLNDGNCTVIASSENRFAEYNTRHRLGQGAFRISVIDAYQRRCAITGEKTLPVLEAAHIKPYSENGPHSVDNGLLLRSDIHTLFDDGYVTIDKDYRFNVSKRLHEDYGNGKDYYKYDGKKLMILPQKNIELPSTEFLEWHNNNVYLG